jgi:D-alanyl-lipoteichoic acid acyltransferase DltB (MBOAT superfamily)
MVSGVWHGAAWTYVVWGALQGFYMVFSDLSKRTRNQIENTLFGDSGIRKLYAVLVTFNLTAFSFIFFRSNSLSDAFYIVGNLFSNWSIRFDQVPRFWGNSICTFCCADSAYGVCPLGAANKERVRIST